MNDKRKYYVCQSCGEVKRDDDFCVGCGSSQWVEKESFPIIFMIDPPYRVIRENGECGYTYDDGSPDVTKRYCPKCGSKCKITDRPVDMC